ncbi:MAG: OmpP1/FadL family transporter [Steroidobacteraceae bacterium]
MNHGNKKLLGMLGLAAGLASTPALATDGYFAHGYGAASKGMGGASFAVSGHGFAGANNPATAVDTGDDLQFGLEWFSPKRKATRSGSAFLDASVESGREDFMVPEFSWNRKVGEDSAWGVTLYGNGGMNTTYDGGQLDCGFGPNTANLLCGGGRLGVDLAQLVIAPTFAHRIAPGHAIGISPLLGYQKFKAFGLQAFDNPPGFPPFTGSPGNVTNRDYDESMGAGIRLGYHGQFGAFGVGLTWASKMNMGKFKKYKGLFAEQGGFDIPSNYGLGVSWRGESLLVAADVLRIEYSGVNSVGLPSLPVAPLGANNGPGFGWKDITAWRVGAEWQATNTLKLRAGYNKSDNPITPADVTFNILAPGVVRDHYSLGLAWDATDSLTFQVAATHAKKETVTGSSLFNLVFGPGFGGTETISLSEDMLTLSVVKRY